MSIQPEDIGFVSTVNPDVTKRNPRGVIYVSGDDDDEESWRIIAIDSPDELSIEHFEPLTESDITLNEAKVTTIEAFGYSSANKYFASVATDSRSDNTTPAGISGDMTGLFIEFDGTVWLNFTDQWVQKGAFADSLEVDRMLARRTILRNTDPNDLSIHLPAPVAGTSIGSRNTMPNGSGTEMIAFHDFNGDFGHLVEMLHNAPDMNQMMGIKADDTMIGVPYELTWVDGTTYAIDDIVIDMGIRYKSNTAGTQTTSFISNIALWDSIDYASIAFDVDTIVTDGGAVVVNEGNVVTV